MIQRKKTSKELELEALKYINKNKELGFQNYKQKSIDEVSFLINETNEMYNMYKNIPNIDSLLVDIEDLKQILI